MDQPDQMKHENPELLEAELHALEGRDLQLWCLGGIIALILATGFLALLVPRVLWNAGSALKFQQNLPALFLGLLVLLLLAAIYMVQQRVRLTRTRRELVGRLLQAERVARVDELTGLFNRRTLDELLTREMARAQRTGSRLSVVMVDIDGFRALNDRFGHVVSERILQEVSRMLKRNFRAADILLRYGVDEFLAILPETDRREAQIAVDRLYGGVVQWNRRNQDFGYKLGLSCGIAQFIPDASTHESLVEAADAEMYNLRAARRGNTSPQPAARTSNAESTAKTH
ncbi:MAG TPA: GGDEF domain-containing protein [Terriglobales bacterium]|nr:GGDEF domain-containing protein [Terriglobales bacterium]